MPFGQFICQFRKINHSNKILSTTEKRARFEVLLNKPWTHFLLTKLQLWNEQEENDGFKFS